jgi:hypothetical protein
VHIPAQSGNSEVLHNMRRFYTREAYLELIQRMREVIPSTYCHAYHTFITFNEFTSELTLEAVVCVVWVVWFARRGPVQ